MPSEYACYIKAILLSTYVYCLYQIALVSHAKVLTLATTAHNSETPGIIDPIGPLPNNSTGQLTFKHTPLHMDHLPQAHLWTSTLQPPSIGAQTFHSWSLLLPGDYSDSPNFISLPHLKQSDRPHHDGYFIYTEVNAATIINPGETSSLASDFRPHKPNRPLPFKSTSSRNTSLTTTYQQTVCYIIYPQHSLRFANNYSNGRSATSQQTDSGRKRFPLDLHSTKRRHINHRKTLCIRRCCNTSFYFQIATVWLEHDLLCRSCSTTF
ncbi:CLL_collapsed_G0029220.mRNA.1.CDS.1 [Saccharomyces cerevisiae]|nr:CLL_collapsed_G0029220.mRNA.1.CDS.1 [Saccharomyces cerevisiae]